MPFVSLLLPSIGLGLLNASMRERSVASRVFYFSLDFAQRVSASSYARVIEETSQRDLVGEWVFSDALFDHHDEAAISAYRSLLLGDDGNRGINADGMPAELVDTVVAMREHVEPFLDACAERILDSDPLLVGFTSVFQQNVASLALARRLKAARPELFTIFGGANCEGAMGHELVRQFRFVDAAVSGEGDRVFPMIVDRVRAGRSVDDLAGVRTTTPRLPVAGQAAGCKTPTVDLDSLPDPDYDDFFAAHAEAGFELDAPLRILFETSRGCWWGEKHHCTFCGLNGETMAHRSKSADRALAELTRLTQRYPGCEVEVVDNILDMSYFRDFIPALTEAQLDAQLFYEVKANLRKEQIRQLHAAGITVIQPGIESLSDAVLDIMRKGISGLQNIQLLKWCQEIGVEANWNFLTGFPGEPVEDYAQMAEVAPLLTHLRPPAGCFSIRLDRFSPNFDRAEELGFRDLRPYPAYRHVYDIDDAALGNLAYYFAFDYADDRSPDDYVAPLRQQVEQWRESHASSQLTAVENDGRLLLLDTRPVAPLPIVVMEEQEKFAYEACDAVRSPAWVTRAWNRERDEDPLTDDETRRLLDGFVQRQLMLRDGDRYLALAVSVEA
jgi:ribosomal peptide maturation radical SAM protein 1